MTPEHGLGPEELHEKLRGLAPLQRLAFSISCSERLYPNYVEFAASEGWGDPDALRSGLDLAWQVVLGQPVEREVVRALIARVDAVIPDTEDFETPLVSAALDASATVGLVLELLIDDEPALVAQIVSMAYDTIDMHVQGLEELDARDPMLEVKIVRHPLMQAELRRERGDLHLLATTDWSPAEARRLRDAWRAPASSSIGVPLSGS